MESLVFPALLLQVLLLPAQASELPTRITDSVAASALRGAADDGDELKAASYHPGDWVEDYNLFLLCYEAPLRAIDVDDDCALALPIFAGILSMVGVVFVCIGHSVYSCSQTRRKKKEEEVADQQLLGPRAPNGGALTKFRAPGGETTCAFCAKKLQVVYGNKSEKFYICSSCYKDLQAENTVLIEGPIQLNLPPQVGATLSKRPSERPGAVEKEASSKRESPVSKAPTSWAVEPDEAPPPEGVIRTGSDRASVQRTGSDRSLATSTAYGAIRGEEVGVRVSQRASQREAPGAGVAARSSYQATAGRRRPSPQPGTVDRMTSNVSDASEMSDGGSEYDLSDREQARSPRPVGPSGSSTRPAGGGRTRNRRGGEDVVVEFYMTVADVREHSENLEDWVDAQITEQSREKGLSAKQIDKMQENVELTDSKGGKYKSWDELHESIGPELFPIHFKYSAKAGKRKMKRLGEADDDFSKQMGAPITSTASGGGRSRNRRG